MGPLYGFALMFEGSHEAVPPDSPGALRIEGLILDGDGAPLAWPEGFIEFWQGEQFARGRTDESGRYSVVVRKPAAEPTSEGSVLAPYFNVAVFARGLLKQVVTRVYFPDEEAANSSDPVLELVPADDRELLIAMPEGDALRFDIVLQGANETPFFDF
jgi:protocatechuate 3,4-dioxygenase alpha subunit